MAALLGRDRLPDLGRNGFHRVKVKTAIRPARRADADDRHVAVADRILDARRRPDPAAVNPVCHEFVEACFHDRSEACVETLDFREVGIDADDLMAVAREACRRNRAHIAQPENANSHSELPGPPLVSRATGQELCQPKTERRRAHRGARARGMSLAVRLVTKWVRSAELLRGVRSRDAHRLRRAARS